jgi:hypothetical protein
MNKPILDKLGEEIVAGCFIIYGHALGRCAGLRLGKVFKAEKVNVEYRGEVYRIAVRGMDDDWFSFNETEEERQERRHFREPVKLNAKVSTLQFPERMIVVPKSKIPKQFLDLYANLTEDGKDRK